MTISPPPARTEIVTDHFRTFLRPDGIELIAWNPGFTINAELAQAGVDAGREVAGSETRRLLIDMRTSGVMDKQARAIFAAETDWVHAVALWVASPMSMVIANFFLGVSRAPRPTRMFTEEVDAVAWLMAHGR
jgi:hypothetical protein